MFCSMIHFFEKFLSNDFFIFLFFLFWKLDTNIAVWFQVILTRFFFEFPVFVKYFRSLAHN